MRRRLLPALLAAALTALLAPSGAAAAPWTCEASALRGALGPAPPVEPITANKDAAACVAQSAGGNPPAALPGGATGGVLFARTQIEGAASAPASQRAIADGGIGELRVPLLPGLPGLPVPSVPSIPGFPGVDLGPIVAGIAQGDLINARAITARVTGQCLGGSANLAGSSSVGSLTVLGVPIATDRTTNRTITIDSREIDPSTLAPLVPLPPGADPAALQAALNLLPNIQIPEALARVQVTPAVQVRRGDELTQRALTVELSIAGQAVLDFVAGEATVGGTGVPCGEVTAAQALRCTSRRLVLIDVVRRKGRVRMLGAADRRLAGRRVAIHYMDTGKRVARPRVGKDGLFRASAPMPPRAVRGTNRARYQARVGGQRSLALKLTRRLRISSIRPRGRNVVIRGRITRPLASPLQRITVTRRVSCGRVTVATRFKPRRDGRFRVTLRGAKSRQVATFRFRTRVRYRVGNPRLFRTFTLPQYVDIG